MVHQRQIYQLYINIMWAGIGYTIPMITSLPGQSTPGPTPPTGNFIELEPNLFLVALESGLNDLIELE